MKLNVLVDNLGANQLSYYLIKSMNLLAQEGEYQPIVFYDNIQKHCIRPLFSTMQMIEAWGQEGTTIATSISTAIKLLDFPGPSRRLFYVWDLEWLRDPQYSWGPLRDLFGEIELIGRCIYHSGTIKNSFNIDTIFDMDNFDVSKLKEIL